MPEQQENTKDVSFLPKLDASGNKVPTRYDASGNNMPNRLDASGSKVPTRIDPSCARHLN